MATAPYCNVTIARPAADPKKPGTGLQTIPPGATPAQITRITNNNFYNLSRGNFREDLTQRVTTITRIFDPNDSSIYVDVRQITAMEFVNAITGQTINWQQ